MSNFVHEAVCLAVVTGLEMDCDCGAVEKNWAARCSCGDLAKGQALYRRRDGSHFLGGTLCEAHLPPLGPLQHAQGAEIIDYMMVVT